MQVCGFQTWIALDQLNFFLIGGEKQHKVKYFLFHHVTVLFGCSRFELQHAASVFAASKDYSWPRCTGFWLLWLPLCRAQALERRLSSCGPGLSFSMTGGVFLDQGSNSCPLHWLADSSSLDHQESPYNDIFKLPSPVTMFHECSIFFNFLFWKTIYTYRRVLRISQ